MTNTDQKPKKLNLTQQNEELRKNFGKLQTDFMEEQEKRRNAEQETRSVLVKKEKEMCDILNNVLVSMGEKSPSFYSIGMGQRETVPALAGQLMGAIARTLEKNNLQTTIIQELEDQVTWFRSLIEKAFGPKVIKPKVDKSALESVVKDWDKQAEDLSNGIDNKNKK